MNRIPIKKESHKARASSFLPDDERPPGPLGPAKLAAELAGISVEAVLQGVLSGAVRTVKVGRETLFDLDDVEALARGRAAQGGGA